MTFTPDRRTCEAIFRAWPNKPEAAASGNRLEVTSVAVEGRPVKPVVEAAGAPRGTPGTLIRVPVNGCAPAGGKVTVDLAFSLTLGADGGERVGYSSEDRTAWMATAFPLLAWVRGSGWATDPAVDLFGETVTSEEFRLASLKVVAPKGDEVLGTGQAQPTAPGPDGTVVHRFTAESVRDVAVTVGRLTVVERTVAGVRVHVGAPAGTMRSAGGLGGRDRGGDHQARRTPRSVPVRRPVGHDRPRHPDRDRTAGRHPVRRRQPADGPRAGAT